MGFPVSVPGATPIPESGMLKFESEAVEVTLMLLLELPADCGEKVTEKFAV